jgi:uncharacterized protein YggE
MKFWISALAVAALAVAEPALAEDLAPGEIKLHISAQGAIPAEFATWEMELIGEGATKAAAAAALSAQEAETKVGLNEMAAEARISISDPVFEETEQVDWEGYRGDAAAADAVDAAPTNSYPMRVEVPVVEEAYESADYDNLPKKKVWTAKATLKITVSDSAKIAQAIAVSRGAYSYGNPRPQFGFADEAKASRDAVAAALANARKEAEAHADAMGYKIVRIVAVSNDGAPLSLPDIVETIATLDNLRQWGLLGHKIATVTVDYAIAPK